MENIKRKGEYGFTLYMDRLEKVVVAAYDALQNREGIFATDYKQHLPQWNIPKELEYDPQQKTPEDVDGAIQFLFTEMQLERRAKSREIMKNVSAAWNDERTKWIFNPHEVRDVRLELVESVFVHKFRYTLQSENEASPWKRYKDNMTDLVATHGGDAREITEGKTVKEAREYLVNMKGVGTGIANLYLTYLIDRDMAMPSDPINGLLKVDVHKSRIPIMLGAVVPNENQIYRDEAFAEILEQAYHALCKKHNMNAVDLDNALWTIGSSVCALKNAKMCGFHCPLSGSCNGYCNEDPQAGRFIVYDGDKRVDLRKDADQLMLF